VTADGLASRQAAYRALRRVHSSQAWAQRAVDSVLRRGDLDVRDRAFAANLAYETLRWEGTLDWVLARVLTRPLSAVQPEVLDVLRMGAWQLLYGGTPDRAAVGTAVDLARAEIGPQSTGFVNGVLRGLVRGKDSLPWPPTDTDEGLGLALAYPAWVVAEARQVFGDRARAVLEAGNAAPGLTLRATGDPAALIAELREQGHDAQPGRAAPEAVRVPGADPAALPAVAEGRATPQDEASMLVVRRLAEAAGVPAGSSAAGGASPLDGRLVFDAAAAPGGKSTHLAHLGARVVAADLRPGRAALIAQLAQRLEVADRVRVLTADASAPPFRPSSFDAVLLDAPCTGLGVVRRRPELRWRRDPGDPARLGALQVELLEAVAPLVRPGGTLLYSVCTWPAAETADVVEAFLAADGDRFTQTGDAVQLDPDRDGVDAMYLCAFARR
jgi:16S rRNA (cytosine967-C5)-methyltransferase